MCVATKATEAYMTVESLQQEVFRSRGVVHTADELQRVLAHSARVRHLYAPLFALSATFTIIMGSFRPQVCTFIQIS